MSMEIEVNSALSVGGRPLHMINESEVSMETLGAAPEMRQLAAQLSRWVDNARAATGRTSMFDRGMFTPPDNHYDEMRAARNAVRYDPLVAGVAEVTEAFAFAGVKWESQEPDVAAPPWRATSAGVEMGPLLGLIWHRMLRSAPRWCGGCTRRAGRVARK